MLIRIFFIIIPLLSFTQPAPSPYFTRSFVQTPSSTFEQYLIVPDKSDAYRVPMSQVHHYSDFQFPKQQVVYYNPSTGTNQQKLQTLKKDNPLWQQMLMNLHSSSGENMVMNDDAEMSGMSENMEHKVMNEDTMRMILDQENPSSDMMEKLKRDDTKISEMMKSLEESTTVAPKLLMQPIVVPSDEDMTVEDMNETSNMMNINGDTPNVMEATRNLTNEIVQVTPQIHPEMTRVIIPESIILASEEVTPENIEQPTDMTALNDMVAGTPPTARIAELLSNVETFEVSTIINEDIQMISTTDRSPFRKSKEMTLEIMRNIKDHPEIMIKLVELTAASIEQMESDLRSGSMEPVGQSDSTTESVKIESSESSVPLLDESDQTNIMESITTNPEIEASTELSQLSTNALSSAVSNDNEVEIMENPTTLSSLIPSMSSIEVKFENSMTTVENSKPESDNSKQEIELTTTTPIVSLNDVKTIEKIESSTGNEVRADLESSTESTKITESPESLDLSSSTEATKTTESLEDRADLSSSTEATETTESPELLQSTTVLAESSTEIEQLEIVESSTESEFLESSQETEAVKLNVDESTEAINTPMTVLQESSSTESSETIQISMTSKEENSNQFDLTMDDNIDQSVIRSDIPLNVNDNESDGNNILSSDEQTSSESSERESELQEEQITLKEGPQSETMREGRVNKAPTMFLHNNRFYVISGVPEFYANFDAYQNPRTPIFSLQELQPIRPMNNVAIQKIEPFRVYVDDNEEQKSGTQDDNEPLKIQNSTTDNPRSDIENTQTMNVEQSEMTVKVKKGVQDRQPASEVKQDDEEEQSVAQASPEATSISGRGGVSSAGPKGIALSNKGGISVASPRATAIAGKFQLNDSDEGIDVDFEDDVKVSNRRRVQVAKRKIIRGRRNWRM